uniref:Uncharacterized protein n=1 Tax=Timema genevievae TaxID=629358 RepID=A0A7R9PSD6_TIMGE|nr:unnamed protein product [Timema genevievae]
MKYDIVVSAYALFELPSSESRLETILALWNKTQAYLVIVEQGTNAGFKIVNEARDFILYNSKNDDNLLPQAHVFAPCNTVSVMKNFIKKGRQAHKLYVAGLEEEEN